MLITKATKGAVTTILNNNILLSLYNIQRKRLQSTVASASQPDVTKSKSTIAVNSNTTDTPLFNGTSVTGPLPSLASSIGEIKPLDIPLNVLAVYHKPLRVPITYGDLIADIQLRSYDHENLDFFCDFILRVGFYLGAPLTGPKPLPTRRERWTVIRAPFVHAKSKENFERHTHKRLIRVWDTNPQVVDMLLSYLTKHSITGVGVKVNYFQREGLTLNEPTAKDETNILDGLQQGETALKNEDAVSKKVEEILSDPKFKAMLNDK
ncbi:mitochondrial 37S ribosomal protein uS10m SCDLUD_003708 [Saccharomycodes ludwigii]|uniref:mitochondrial 37S ribosomal protein uS10m n=1 Tax=Saccharomycodes ludwigii TaxID=36035 RepID=UPI001E889DB9|nr:hypothetical protein SCDLUD_003708 [Saccharomycodes ludwigii]KAH3900706.1 hypothetical protein SCDLUD_003708 [Saccharomycodes ludwigii]